MIESVLLSSVLGALAPREAPFTPVRLSRSYIQHLVAPPAEIFPLLGPAGERKWAKGWNPRFLYPATAPDEEGSVFATPHETGETYWVLSRFDRAALKVQYVQFRPGERITVIQVALAPDGARGTAAEVRYTWTVLAPSSLPFLEAHRGHAFDDAMADWESQINACLARAAGEPRP